MNIFKPIRGKHGGDMLEENDTFYQYTHLENSKSNGYTLCGVADEEWEREVPLTKITCPECLDIIKHCKQYKT